MLRHWVMAIVFGLVGVTGAQAACQSYALGGGRCPCTFVFTQCLEEPPIGWPYYGTFDYCRPDGTQFHTRWYTQAQLDAQNARFFCYWRKCTYAPRTICE